MSAPRWKPGDRVLPTPDAWAREGGKGPPSPGTVAKAAATVELLWVDHDDGREGWWHHHDLEPEGPSHG